MSLSFLKNATTKILCAMALIVMTQGYCEESYCWCPCDNSILQFGVNYTRVNLNVEGEPTFSGNMGGLKGCYEYRPLNNFFGGLRVAWKEGSAENSDETRDLTYVDVQERLGYTYAPCCEDWSVTVFTGFGYRYLGHKLFPEGEPSIKFDYNEFYIPVGILADYSLNSWCMLGVNLIWMPQVFPSVTIVPLSGARWILRDTLSNVLVEFPLTFYPFEDNCFSLILKPFYEHWEDGRSTAVTASGNALGLPRNEYNFWGIELNLGYSF